MLKFVPALLLICAAAAAQTPKPPDAARLQRMGARFSPTEMRVSVSGLSAGDRKALGDLIRASRIVNDIFLDQLWKGNRALFAKLRADRSALGRARQHYFWLNKSPWSEIDDYAAFLPGVPPRKPLGANFYPEDMTKEEFTAWFQALSPEQKEQASGFYTVIRRDAAGKLRIVPYSEAYRPDLERAAALLRKAAAETDNATLRKFLELRAAAFLSNDYFDSDVAWMDLDAPIDVTIGPYETYNDGLFGYKAAFESYVTVRDAAESKKLEFFSQHLQNVEDHLPEDPKFRVKKLGAASPIRVVNEVFAAGDGNHGVQSVAYNLPNDDRVVQQKGAKRIMLRNVNEAKFRKILLPISKIVLSPRDQKDVEFDSFFSWILSHELSHGIGPHQIEVDGKETNPRLELKDLYSAIEEAKADITGLFLLQFLMDQKAIPGGAEAERRLYTTVLASAFRTLHFGLQDAHARGQAVQMNYLLDKGGYVAHPDGTFSVDFTKIKSAVEDLDREFLTLEATGDYARTQKMMTDLGVLRPEVKAALDRMGNVPTDIEPVFVTAESVAPAGTAPARGKTAKNR
ncbi:MAG: dipeptidyl-peptidase 3 family protein [Thermoanaerobaculia bacterium]